MIKVLHIINGEHYAGAERVQDLLAQNLPNHGYSIDFAGLKPDKFPGLRRCQDTPFYKVPMRSRIDLSPVVRLVQLIRKHSYALIHTHTPRAVLIGNLASRLCRVPLVHHVHSPTSDCTERLWRNWAATTSERINLSRASRLIAVSESLADYLRNEGFSHERIIVVNNGVPTPNSLSHRYRPSGKWSIGTVALFRPRKGLEVLLQALKRLQSDNISCQLIAVGAFETMVYRDSIIRLSEQLGLTEEIQWVGFVPDVASQLAKMDIFVLPSLYGEGLPMVVLEAMAAGVPVISTQVEGIPEVIEHGVTGLLVKPSDPVELADAIRKIILGDVSWNTMRTAAYALQRSRFSDLSMAEGVARIYKQVLP